MASSTEAILSGERVVILLSRVPLEMVMMPSRLTTHALGMPQRHFYRNIMDGPRHRGHGHRGAYRIGRIPFEEHYWSAANRFRDIRPPNLAVFHYCTQRSSLPRARLPRPV